MLPPIGFILVTYKKPQQIIRLINKLNRMFYHPPIACHHDFFKSELPVDALGSNVSLVHPHLRTDWGVFAVVEAMLSALQLMYKTHNSPDWFIFLSETDYPIKPANRILDDLASSPYDVHMHHEQINYKNYEREWQERCYKRYCTIKVLFPILNKQLSLSHPLLTAPFLPFSDNLRCFAGEHWFCANRKAAEYLIEFHRRRPALAKHYRSSSTIIPGKSYFHTILCNAPQLKVSNDNLRYIDWSTNPNSPSPKTLLFEDMQKIQASSAHFARKFDIDEDVRILNELDDIVE